MRIIKDTEAGSVTFCDEQNQIAVFGAVTKRNKGSMVCTLSVGACSLFSNYGQQETSGLVTKTN